MRRQFTRIKILRRSSRENRPAAENPPCRLAATNRSPSDQRKSNSLVVYSGFAITPQAMRAGALAEEVCDGVNHDGSPTVAEYRIVTTLQADVGSHDANMRSVIRRDDQRKIRDVAGRYGAVLVIGLRTTEVWARGFEIRWIAFAYLLDVNRMLARREILDVAL